MEGGPAQTLGRGSDSCGTAIVRRRSGTSYRPSFLLQRNNWTLARWLR